MVMKPLADVLQQLSGGLEIMGGAGHGGVSQLSCEQRELGRKMVTLLIPCQEAVNGKRVAKVMDARPSLSLGATEAHLAHDFQKDGGEQGVSVLASREIDEKGCGGRRRVLGLAALLQIGGESTGGGRRERDVTRLPEFALPNEEQPAFEIHVCQRQV